MTKRDGKTQAIDMLAADEVTQQNLALVALAPQPLIRNHGPLYRQLATLLRASMDGGQLQPGSVLSAKRTWRANLASV